MRILMVRTDFTIVDTDGYNSQELGLAKALVALGHEVDIVTRADSSGRPKKVQHASESSGAAGRAASRRPGWIKLPARRLPVAGSPAYRGLRQLLALGDYDLVHINEEGNPTVWSIARNCVRLGIPFVLYHGIYRLPAGRSHATYERLHDQVLRPFIRRRALSVFAKSTAAERFLARRGYAAQTVLPVGLDIAAFDTIDSTDWHARLGIPNDCRLLVYVGVLESRRNPGLLLDIAERLGPDHHVLIVGEGPERAALEHRIEASAIANVTLGGRLRQNELPALYTAADLLLLPSDYEIYGMIVLEALHFGCPVLSTATAGPTDILDRPALGRLMADLDPEQWASAARSLGRRSGGAHAVAERQAAVRDRFDWTALARRYLAGIGEPTPP